MSDHEEFDPNDPDVTRDPERTVSPSDPEQTLRPDEPDRVERPEHAAGAEHAGQVINQYTLVRLLGEGGFGTVWLAEQTEPVRRQVALKIIKLGMDTRQVIARFEAERQALAVMDHPNIAKVFDAGSTDTGRPYFVMEYADGVTFTRYCDEHQLSVRARLRLFQKVCHAVQHAHQKGIIHRDIKPSNVIVVDVDGEPAPKVIDFGIAKATEARLTEHSMFTEQGQVIGTPAYMSPEQTGLQSEDIDTRSDIYSLGVLLYETVTGESPFNDKTLLSAGMDEIRRIIREVDPPKPSTRLSTAGMDITTAAQHRAIEPNRLRSLLAGDIDLIVMKAIDKDRTRRYQTATSFAEDIERYLHNEPVIASPPSAQYRVKKFVRRNRFAVTAAALVLGALLVGTVGTTIGLVRATKAEGEAVRAAQDAESARSLESVQRQLADERAEEARIERDKAEQVAVFLTDMLAGVGAQVAQGADTTLLRGILNKTATRVGEELVDQPEIEAEIRNALGNTFWQIRDFERAEENYLRALERYRSVHADDAADVAATLGNLGLLRVTEERAEESAELLREALGMWHRLDPEDPQAIPRAMVRLANTLVRLKEYSEAEELLVGAMERLRLDPGDHREDIGIISNSLANLMQHLDEYERAEDYYRRALELHRAALGDDHPYIATNLHNLALMLASVGRNKEAIGVQEEALARSRVLYPDGHEQIASSLVALANLYRYDDERSPEAPGMIREAIALQSKLYGEGSRDVAHSHHELGRILSAQRDYEGAVVAYERAIALYAALYGERNNNVAVSMDALARTLGSLERYDEAGAMFDRVIEIQNGLFGEAHQEPAITLVNLGSMHRKAGNYEAAEEAIVRALAVFDAAGLGRSSFAASSHENLGQIHRATGRLADSADALRRGLDIRMEVDGPNARNTLGACYALSGTLIDIEAFDEAEALLQRVMDDPDGVINQRIRLIVQKRYADLLFASERFDECAQVLEVCYRDHLESGSSEDASEALTQLVRASERRQELDPTPANEEATARWRRLLDEFD